MNTQIENSRTDDTSELVIVAAPQHLIETTDLAQVGGGWAAGVW